MISIIDYGIGNVQAFLNIYKRLGMPCRRVNCENDLIGSTHLILPGVGHFDHAMKRLTSSGMLKPLEQLVLVKKVPLLGVCVGMQMLADRSDEGSQQGLGWIAGHVKSFNSNSNSQGLPMPHMGWNDVYVEAKHKIFKEGFDTSGQFYFLHSYYFETMRSEDVSARAEYGFKFDAAVSAGNIHGVQFHPEKSHKWGEQLLKNFSEI
jgi:glutamine amidotransferase